jgi:hypothetical protein
MNIKSNSEETESILKMDSLVGAYLKRNGLGKFSLQTRLFLFASLSSGGTRFVSRYEGGAWPQAEEGGTYVSLGITASNFAEAHLMYTYSVEA